MVVYKALNTTIEGIVADACHAIGDSNGGQATATMEGFLADAGYAFRDDKIFYFCCLVAVKMFCICKRICRKVTKFNTTPCSDIRHNNSF